MPFCTRKCPYCTFFHVPHTIDLESAFTEALVREISDGLSSLGASVYIQSVYFGGGTPSVLSVESIGTVFSALLPFIPPRGPDEITFELNPEDVTEGLLSCLRGKGINRASLGVQSMGSADQEWLGRCSPQVNDRAVSVTKACFGNINIDMLLGIPGRSPHELEKSVELMCAFAPQHFSIYCLEPAEKSQPRVQDFFTRVDADRSADEYLFVCETLRKRGYRHYEVSNFALPGFESVHNRVYWKGGEYLGVGPGAHSFIDGKRFFNEASLDLYISQPYEDKEVIRIEDIDESYDPLLEKMMLALRTDEGMPLEWAKGAGNVVDSLVAEGLAGVSGGKLVLSNKGFLLLDEILLRIYPRSGGSP